MLLRELLSEGVTVNKTLNPKLWDRNELKPEVKRKLLKIAAAFKDSIGIDIRVIDITLTGSNANYAWSQYSDLDLHLIVPGKPSDAAKELYSAKKTIWGDQHDVTIKGLPVECYVQGQDEEHHSTGVYSLLKDQWLVEPRKVKPQYDDAAVQAKTQTLAMQARRALIQGNLTHLQRVKDEITQMRKAGLARAGEWSTENLTFKEIRNMGLIDKLSDRIRELEDQDLSLEARPAQP